MFRLVLVLGLTSIAHGLGRIVGGENAEIKDYNYQCSLRFPTIHICGCFLVTSDIAVTAAQCVDKYTSRPGDLYVVAGTNDRFSGGEMRIGIEVYIHEKFNKENFDYDVGIVILEAPFDLTDKIGPIQLADKNLNIKVMTPSWVTGWGATVQQGRGSIILQVVEVPNVNWDFCVYQYYERDVTKRMSCWGHAQGGKGPCSGDAGSPLVIDGGKGKHVVAGIVSWGSGCAKPLQPGVYADITNEEIHNFITQYTLA